MELTNRILEIMEKSGLTPSEFADKIEVQRSAISHITSGRNKPSLEFLIKIKNSFPDIDTDWLIFGIEKEPIWEENTESLETAPASTDSYPTLFDLDKTQEISIEQKEQPKEDSTDRKSSSYTDKKIIRAILFYDDGSFEDFSPNK